MSEQVTNVIKSQWHALVCDASANCTKKLDEELESYLVFALIRFTQQPALSQTSIALEYLRTISEGSSSQVATLRELGDKCLLLSGLFPQISRRRSVNVGYYVNMGQASYSQLGQLLHKGFARLYLKLAQYFVCLTDVLHAMRELNGIPVMDVKEKYEFWNDYNSDYARKSLREIYGVLPMRAKNDA